MAAAAPHCMSSISEARDPEVLAFVNKRRVCLSVKQFLHFLCCQIEFMGKLVTSPYMEKDEMYIFAQARVFHYDVLGVVELPLCAPRVIRHPRPTALSPE